MNAIKFFLTEVNGVQYLFAEWNADGDLKLITEVQGLTISNDLDGLTPDCRQAYDTIRKEHFNNKGAH